MSARIEHPVTTEPVVSTAGRAHAPATPGSGSIRPTAGRGSRLVLADRYARILDIAERLAETHDREALLRAIVDEAAVGLEADATVLRLLRGDRLEVVAWSGLDDDVAAALPVFGAVEGWFGELVRTGRPWVVEDVATATEGSFYARYAGIYEFRADIIVPLMRAGQVIGSLSAVAMEPRRWTRGDVDFVSALATHAAIALQNSELFARTELRAAQLGVLQAASARLSRAGGVREIGRAIVEETRGIIDYHNARVYMLEPGGAIEPIAFEGVVGEYVNVDFSVLRTRLGHGFTGWVAEHGEPLLVDDCNSDPRGATIPGTADVDESMLVVPMAYDGVVIGVITLSKLGLRQFDADDQRLLLILADLAATAMESARLLARSQALAGELRRLLDMSSQLSGSLDSRQVANLTASHLASAMGVDECAISYWDRQNRRTVTLGSEPESRLADLEPTYDLTDFPATVEVLEQRLTLTIDAEDPTADSAEVRLLRADGNRSIVMLPLIVKGQSIGLVELISRTAAGLDPERLELARTMANEAAMALENARLYEEARALADRDPLTGFYNHRYLHQRFAEEVGRTKRARQPLSVLMLDLDNFKLVNDSFGHLYGDRVLAWSAEIIRSTLRSSDIAARYGGDEFAIVLPDTSAEAAERAADRIRMAFATGVHTGEAGEQIDVALSIGVATFPADGRTATELLAAADAALYREKRGQESGSVRGRSSIQTSVVPKALTA
jgi:diguanylate cyclase (GGDEF)-like protein